MCEVSCMGLEAYWADFKTTSRWKCCATARPNGLAGTPPAAPRSRRNARSLLPLSNHPRLMTAPASWTHSKRFAWQFIHQDAPAWPRQSRTFRQIQARDFSRGRRTILLLRGAKAELRDSAQTNYSNVSSNLLLCSRLDQVLHVINVYPVMPTELVSPNPVWRAFRSKRNTHHCFRRYWIKMTSHFVATSLIFECLGGTFTEREHLSEFAFIFPFCVF